MREKLFDANTPAPLARFLRGHDVVRADELGWQGLENGALLDAADRAGFGLLLTGNQNVAAADFVQSGQIVRTDVEMLLARRVTRTDPTTRSSRRTSKWPRLATRQNPIKSVSVLYAFMPMKVREVVRLLEKHGWVEIRRKGSHRHFKHPSRAFVITVPGNDEKELAPGTLDAILRKAELK